MSQPPTQAVASAPPEPWHTIAATTVMERFQSAPTGLTAAIAAAHLIETGPNELTDAAPVQPWRILVRQFTSIIVWILLGAAAIAGFLGEWIDAGAIAGIVVINAIIGFVQEHRAETAIAALRRMTAPHARVRRDGQVTELPASAVVPGDIILLEAGDVVAADARLIRTASLACVESALTGESLPAEKSEAVLDRRDLPLGDRANMVFLGTAVSVGTGEAVVVGTGMATEIGRIAGLIRATGDLETPLQKRLDAVGRVLVFATLGIVAVLFTLGMLRGQPALELFMTCVSLAVAAVPEGLPAVVTVALALGVQRMARRRALIRRLPAVETLGSTSVICTDKTGTLTMNEMTVRVVQVAGAEFLVDGEGYAPTGSIRRADGRADGQDRASVLDQLLKLAGGCNAAELRHEGDSWKIIGDPTDGALLTLAAKGGWPADRIEREHPKQREFPFDSNRKRMTVIRDAGRPWALVKGAPDQLLGLCTQVLTDAGVQPLDEKQRSVITSANVALADRALRVLGVAYRDLQPDLTGYTADSVERDLVWVGMIGMQDPPRPEAKDAVVRCHAAGIRVIMITGDHPNTALAIARELGIATGSDQRALSGTELDAMDDEALKVAASQTPVYARVTAAHKLRIVNALKANGAVVAMTGDGVNDAPAIKGADIGVAMGISGTEVTKEAAAMIVTDDNFATIVAAVEEGRGVYTNIRKTIEYLLAGNVGELLLMTVCIVVGLPMPLLPVHLLWINLVSDGLPAICLATDPIDRTLMQRPPRAAGERLMNRRFLWRIGFIGLLTGGIAFAVFFYGLRYQNLATAQANAFSVLVFAELLRSFGARSETRFVWELGFFSNLKLLAVVALTIAIQIASHHVAWLGQILHTVPMTAYECAVLIGLGFIPLVVLELAKIPQRWRIPTTDGSSDPVIRQ